MTLVRIKNRPQENTFNNLIDDIFPQFPSIISEGFNFPIKNSIPVNIKENELGYNLEVVAPGFVKEDFKINIENNLLSISVDKKENTEEKNSNDIRIEYKYQSFKRTFNIDEKIDCENIVAKYQNGVLTLNLPRKQEVKEATKQISIQ